MHNPEVFAELGEVTHLLWSVCLAGYNNVTARLVATDLGVNTARSHSNSPNASKQRLGQSKTIQWIRHGQAYNNIGKSLLGHSAFCLETSGIFLLATKSQPRTLGLHKDELGHIPIGKVS